MTTSDCCVGEPCYGDPKGLHSDDCPVYLANMAAFEANRRREREQHDAERAAQVARNAPAVDGLRRAITHLRDVSAGVTVPDDRTARLLDLAVEVGEVLRNINHNEMETRS